MDEMGGACGAYGVKEMCTRGFGEKELKEKDHLESLRIDGSTILK
jgi:hypothetical protein